MKQESENKIEYIEYDNPPPFWIAMVACMGAIGFAFGVACLAIRFNLV